MSRIDVHRPWDVQLADPYARPLLYWYPAWGQQQALTPYKNIGCGCKMCTQQFWHKQQHRIARAAWRATRQRALKLVDRSDFDEGGRSWTTTVR